MRLSMQHSLQGHSVCYFSMENKYYRILSMKQKELWNLGQNNWCITMIYKLDHRNYMYQHDQGIDSWEQLIQVLCPWVNHHHHHPFLGENSPSILTGW